MLLHQYNMCRSKAYNLCIALQCGAGRLHNMFKVLYMWARVSEITGLTVSMNVQQKRQKTARLGGT